VKLTWPFPADRVAPTIGIITAAEVIHAASFYPFKVMAAMKIVLQPSITGHGIGLTPPADDSLSH